jgi:hypothetical protein
LLVAPFKTATLPSPIGIALQISGTSLRKGKSGCGTKVWLWHSTDGTGEEEIVLDARLKHDQDLLFQQYTCTSMTPYFLSHFINTFSAGPMKLMQSSNNHKKQN